MYPLLVQCIGEAANACEALSAQRVHDACEVQSALSGVGLQLLHRIPVANLLAPKGTGSVGIAQLDTPGLGSREGSLSVL